MITIDNYFSTIATLDKESLPDNLKPGYEFVNEATAEGKTWEAYKEPSIKEIIDGYFVELDKYLKSKSNKPAHKEKPGTEKKPAKAAKPAIKVPMPKKQETEAKPGKLKTNPPKQKAAPEPEIPVQSDVNLVERIPEELRFIRRYVNLDGKTKTEKQILSLLNGLQKAILEKRIRKTSPWAEQIRYMQAKLIETFNKMKGAITCKIPKKTLDEFKFLLGEEKIFPSIAFIKRYISLNGRRDVVDKAKNLLKQVKAAIAKKMIGKKDPYYKEVVEIMDHLQDFVHGPGKQSLEIEEKTLNGLEGILGCACQDLNGLDETEDESPTFMNSVDFVKLNFETIGLKEKWRELIGDPAPGFTAMVFGRPKMGKSYLCVEFAGYLARNHGKVLYVAKEEKLDATLQLKLKEKDVAHPNLYVSDHLRDNLQDYDFIFLDSVNTLELSADDLTELEETYPDQSFIYVFQSTKAGNFRGAQKFQHNVDVVIEVPEKGKAVQFGRFNQGGEMNIFDELKHAA